MDTLIKVVHKSELSDLILDLRNPQLKYGFLLLNGEAIEEKLVYKYIYSIAKRSINIVDDYIGVITLFLLIDVPSSVEVIIFSDKIGKELHSLEYQDFFQEYPFRKVILQNPVESLMTDKLLSTGIPNIGESIIAEHLPKM